MHNNLLGEALSNLIEIPGRGFRLSPKSRIWLRTCERISTWPLPLLQARFPSRLCQGQHVGRTKTWDVDNY